MVGGDLTRSHFKQRPFAELHRAFGDQYVHEYVCHSSLRAHCRRMGLVLRTIQTIQQTPPSRFPGESRDPLPPWAPAFAGEAGLSEVLGCLVNRVNDPEDYARHRMVSFIARGKS